MSDDTPTELFTPPTAPDEPSASATSAGTPQRSKTLIIALAVMGGLLLIAVVALLALLFARGTDGASPAPSISTSPTPEVTAIETPIASPSATPSTTPTQAPTTPPSPNPPPVITGPVFNSFSPKDNSSVGCTGNSGDLPLTFTWTSTGASEAAIGVQTYDAFAGPYETGLPASGSYTGLSYNCSQATQFYTVSIRGVSGQTNKTITLRR
ncbi:MAG: hypothetical protein ABIT21_00775 [Terrimesophilobacter sp.]